MSDPYEVLGLPRTADEAETRPRYLELVRQFPPDRDPTAVRRDPRRLRPGPRPRPTSQGAAPRGRLDRHARRYRRRPPGPGSATA